MDWRELRLIVEAALRETPDHDLEYLGLSDENSAMLIALGMIIERDTRFSSMLMFPKVAN